ncbi:NAD(P)-binding protein [Trichoderma austrokoningii]
MTSKVFNVGVVGYGLSAKVFHIPFITTTPSLTLHSIVQRTPKPNDSAPADYPTLKHYTDATSLIADPDVDVIVVTTPPDNHFALTKAALQAGKHVLTEKPFVPTAAEAQQLADISKQTGKLICVYQNRRWDADFLLARHLIQQGTLGRIIEFNTHFDRYRADAPTTWKGQLGISQGGSALFDLGTHLIDQAYVLFGLPQSVRGRLLNQREGRPDFETPDAVSAQLLYASGLLVNVGISALSAETRQLRYWVRGTKGSFRKFGLDPQEDQLRGGGKPTDAGYGVESVANSSLTAVDEATGTANEVPVPELEPETYRAFYRQFADALVSGKAEDVPVTAEQARDVLRIIEGVLESAKTGKDAILA